MRKYLLLFAFLLLWMPSAAPAKGRMMPEYMPLSAPGNQLQIGLLLQKLRTGCETNVTEPQDIHECLALVNTLTELRDRIVDEKLSLDLLAYLKKGRQAGVVRKRLQEYGRFFYAVEGVLLALHPEAQFRSDEPPRFHI